MGSLRCSDGDGKAQQQYSRQEQLLHTTAALAAANALLRSAVYQMHHTGTASTTDRHRAIVLIAEAYALNLLLKHAKSATAANCEVLVCTAGAKIAVHVESVISLCRANMTLLLLHQPAIHAAVRCACRLALSGAFQQKVMICPPLHTCTNTLQYTHTQDHGASADLSTMPRSSGP